jgi:rod shape-determining protein MreD
VFGCALLVVAVPMLQGALGPYLPRAFRPDLALLVLLGLSLCWRNSLTGLVLVSACGFVVDLFSGGLLGQHALLGVLVFGAARALSLHVNLIGTPAQMLFVALLTAAHALGLAALASFFTPDAPVLLGLGELLPRALANAILAPLVTAGVAALVAWMGGEEGGRRPLRLEPRRWAA